MTWRCPHCKTPMTANAPANSGNWVGPFIRREHQCPNCGHQMTTREHSVVDLGRVEQRVVDLECALARYQDELWEQGKL